MLLISTGDGEFSSTFSFHNNQPNIALGPNSNPSFETPKILMNPPPPSKSPVTLPQICLGSIDPAPSHSLSLSSSPLGPSSNPNSESNPISNHVSSSLTPSVCSSSSPSRVSPSVDFCSLQELTSHPINEDIPAIPLVVDLPPIPPYSFHPHRISAGGYFGFISKSFAKQ